MEIIIINNISDNLKNQIDKFVGNKTNESHYFLIQVGERGSENILRNGRYKAYDHHFRLFNNNDIVLVYFTKQSIDYKQQLKKIYRIIDISKQNNDIQLSEEYELKGIVLDTIKYAIKIGKLKSIFNKLGQQSFNMMKINKSDYDSILLLDKEQIQISSNELSDYERLHNFISKIMDAKTTYQPIMIRTILENGIALKETIDEKIRLENPNKENIFVSRELYEVLVDKHKIVKLDSNSYKLNLVSSLSQNEIDKLIELCNQEIVRIRENYQLLKKMYLKSILVFLINIIKREENIFGNEIYGIYEDEQGKGIRKSPLPPDEMVNEPHYLHNLIRGVYTLANDEYALSIQLNPQSKWDLEIDRNHPTLKINYDFRQVPTYKPNITKLQNCYKNDVPIGIIFKTIKGKNKILGLGKIVSFNTTKFVIDSYGISEEESILLKEETIKEFDASLAHARIIKN